MVLMGAPDHGFDQVTELFCGELIPFQVGYQLPLAIDDSSVKGMGKLSFVRPKTHSAFWIGFPSLGVIGQDFRVVVDRVEGDGEKNQISAHALLETLLQTAKVIGQPITVFRQSATGIDEIHRYDFAGQLMERNAPLVLVRESEIRYRLTGSQSGRRN